MILANNFEQVLNAFNDFEANYLIAGGYAVIFHGYTRTTGDLDIWVKPDHDNKNRIIQAIKKLRLSTELTDHLQQLDFTTPFAVKLGDEPLQVDIFNAITGVKYVEAEKKNIPYVFNSGLEVRFIHLDDLIANKMLIGRLKDKADVEQLQKIKESGS